MNRFPAAMLVGLVALLTIVGCQQQAPPQETVILGGQALAGPTCPVVSDPPDPACADRPVAGAVLIVKSEDGNEVLRLTTDGDGRFDGALAPGSYTLVPQPVEGLVGTAPEQQLTVEGELSADLVVTYETGIR